MAHYMDIHRGDRFDYMVSVSSSEASLSAYVKANFADGDPKRAEKYICGDMNTSIIKTQKGRTILLQHDVVNPRPYSRINSISGTKGAFADYPPRVFVDGSKQEDWQNIDAFRDKYEHPLWKTTGEMARKMGGHGGMDYVMNYRLMDCLKRGLVPDLNVLRCRRMERAHSIKRSIGGAEWRSPEIPGFHPREVERQCGSSRLCGSDLSAE